MNNYVAPKFNLPAFNCPYCSAFSHMIWYPLVAFTRNRQVPFKFANNGTFPVTIHISVCCNCEGISYWDVDKKTKLGEDRVSMVIDYEKTSAYMILPKASIAPYPHEDMPEDIKLDYLEARNIVNDSPRGASALLRLAIQKLCVHLGGKGKKIDDDIAFLVQNGLSKQIQSALDIVRVVGNNSVHPGELSNDDIQDSAITLFELVNLIVDNQITQPKKIDEMYTNLVPESIREKRTEAVSK